MLVAEFPSGVIFHHWQNACKSDSGEEGCGLRCGGWVFSSCLCGSAASVLCVTRLMVRNMCWTNAADTGWTGGESRWGHLGDLPLSGRPIP